MQGDFGSLAWVNDDEGHEFVCTVGRDHLNETRLDNLSDEERRSCTDVNQLIGTERW